MKLIAHRGLTDGPSKLENNPNQIEYALMKGFDCEIDLRMENDRLFLGHDGPEHEIPKSFLQNENLWIHAKNLQALHFLCLNSSKYHFFWHESDTHTITNLGFIWTYPKQQLTDISICVMPETFMTLENARHLKCHGICSDYVELLK